MKKIALSLVVIFVLLGMTVPGCDGGGDGNGGNGYVPPSDNEQRTVLFSDDFSSNANNWTTYSDSDGSVTIRNGALYIKNFTSSGVSCDSFPGESFSDFILEVETTFIGGNDNNWQQVICRYDGFASYYSLGISADGYYDIEKWDTSGVHILEGPTYSSHINKGQNTNHIKVECIGNSLSLTVNGHLLAQVVDSTLASGEIGLVVGSYGGVYSEVTFDNLVVYEP